jgi:hypothetical protein
MAGKADPFDFDDAEPSPRPRPRPRRKSRMSTSRIIALIVVGLVIVVIVPWALLGGFNLFGLGAFDNPNVTQANLDRIHLGMKLKDVEAIMGCKGSRTDGRDGTLFEWRNGDASIEVAVADTNPGPDSTIVRVSGGGFKH